MEYRDIQVDEIVAVGAPHFNQSRSAKKRGLPKGPKIVLGPGGRRFRSSRLTNFLQTYDQSASTAFDPDGWKSFPRGSLGNWRAPPHTALAGPRP